MKKSTKGILGFILAIALIGLAITASNSLSSTSAKAQTAGSDPGVSIGDNYFSPRTMTIQVGSVITWTNMGMMSHTVTADNGSFDSGTLAPGATFSHTFNTPGTFAYYCRFHGGPGGVGMSGVIIVGSGGGSMYSPGGYGMQSYSNPGYSGSNYGSSGYSTSNYSSTYSRPRRICPRYFNQYQAYSPTMYGQMQYGSSMYGMNYSPNNYGMMNYSSGYGGNSYGQSYMPTYGMQSYTSMQTPSYLSYGMMQPYGGGSSYGQMPQYGGMTMYGYGGGMMGY